MKAWKLELLAAAMSLAMATTAGAQSTNSKTMPADATTTSPGSTMHSDIPKECVSLTGRAMSDCVRDHNASSMRPKSGSTGTTGNADSDARRGTTGAMRNDKSGSGPGSTGTSSGATGTSGTTGAAGAGAAGAGSSGTGGGTAGDTGGAGGGGGK